MSTFISYSRVNSAFVVRLARDLKAAGFDVWLDQLDIPKGTRWDDEIEAAVERSSTFMIVLAPESMESQNVKDELSYAIDSGKSILPVVIKPCKIPLRLRRFQYVDFTDKPYKDSLADIKHLLSNMKQITKPLPVPAEEVPVIQAEDAFVSINEAMVQRDHISRAEPFAADHFESRNPRRKAIALAVILAAIGIAAIGVFAVSAARSRNNIPAAVVTISATPTSSPEPPTLTPTITPTPLPQQITDARGVTMLLVGAGNFLMGSDSGSQDQSPAQTLFLSDFYIDKYEVTNETYKRCVEAGQCKPPRKDGSRTIIGYYSKPEYKKYPVIYVTWDMANDYCSWRGGRLPTEAEWEKAARGPDGHIYPWGNEASCDDANYSGCARKKETEPVNSYQDGRSFYNVMDLAGNVAEWVNSLYDNYPYDTAREDPVASGERVVRGGSFVDTDQQVSALSRQKADPSIAQDTIGFRCVGMPANSINKSTLVTITPTMGLINGTQAAAKTKEHLTATTTALLQLNLTASPSTASTVTIVSPQDITATTKAPTEPPTQSQAAAPTEVIETPTDVVKEAPTDAATAVPTEPPIKTEPAPIVPPPTDPAPTEPAPTDPAPTDPAPQGEPAPTDPGITP